MKKLITISLVIVVLFTFMACSNNNSNDAEDKTSLDLTEVADLIAETTSLNLTEISDSVTQATYPTTVKEYLVATDEDFDSLSVEMLSILMNVPNRTPVFGECDYEEYKELVKNSTAEDYADAYYYNSESDDALGCAMYIIWNGRMGAYSDFGLDVDYDIYYSESDQNQFIPDPKHKFVDYPGYIKFNADQIDLILKEVFLVEPDRTKTSEDFDIESYDNLFQYYYYDGYYYYCYDEGGGGDDLPEMIDCIEQPDGSYIVKFSNQKSFLEYMQNTGASKEDYIYKIFESSIALKEVDGKKIWSFRYIKPAKYVLVTV